MLEHDASIKRLEQKKVDLGSGLIISPLISFNFSFDMLSGVDQGFKVGQI